MNSEMLEKFQAARKPQISPRFKNISAGWREIGGQKIYFRSRWEANFARYLQFILERGEIKSWEHEPETFWFMKILRGTRSYLPDFRIKENTGRIVYSEVKGWLDPKSKTKLKRMKLYYPTVIVRIVDVKWFKRNTPKLGSIIKGWEHDKQK